MTRLLVLSAALAFLAACDNPAPTTTTEAMSPAAKSCLAAVAQETGEPSVSVLSQDFSEAGTMVSVQVAGAEAPWACLAANDGTVEEVYYTAEG